MSPVRTKHWTPDTKNTFRLEVFTTRHRTELDATHELVMRHVTKVASVGDVNCCGSVEEASEETRQLFICVTGVEGARLLVSFGDRGGGGAYEYGMCGLFLYLLCGCGVTCCHHPCTTDQSFLVLLVFQRASR